MRQQAARVPGRSAMSSNVEIKARVADPEPLAARTEALAGRPCEVIHQEDVFFGTKRGRLKLRILSPGRGELIYYEREDAAGPSRCDYRIVPTERPDAMREVLSAALEVRGVVRKERRLWLVGQTRIHLDRVEGLGDFVELEVVLREDQTVAEGESIARDLMAMLGVAEGDLVAGAYIDLA